MVKVKLTKTELKAQTEALKRFQRFLPMLQLKKQQLQAEIATIVSKAEAVAARERELRAAMNAWIGVVATADGPPSESLNPELIRLLYGVSAHFVRTGDGILIAPAQDSLFQPPPRPER